MCIVPEGSRLSDREQSFHTMVLVLTTRTSKIISYKRENALSTGFVPKKKISDKEYCVKNSRNSPSEGN